MSVKRSEISTLIWVALSNTSELGTTVFCGTRNFELSHRICLFLRNFCVSAEFCGILKFPLEKGNIST